MTLVEEHLAGQHMHPKLEKLMEVRALSLSGSSMRGQV